MGLTPKQSQALDAIERLTVRGVAPSYEQLAEELGLASKSGVHRLIYGLKERGAVTAQYGLKRSISVVGGRSKPSAALDALSDLSVDELSEVLARTVALLAERRGLAWIAATLTRLADKLPRFV